MESACLPVIWVSADTSPELTVDRIQCLPPSPPSPRKPPSFIFTCPSQIYSQNTKERQRSSISAQVKNGYNKDILVVKNCVLQEDHKDLKTYPDFVPRLIHFKFSFFCFYAVLTLSSSLFFK